MPNILLAPSTTMADGIIDIPADSDDTFTKEISSLVLI
eukprot:XP_001707503.1 Hypothetical protein GL50803_98451 [Giardia lamblia ATCC 50803]